ncbi:hypothetical protein [Burkholderia plantarii]|uniref:hypothetical protein n=1 Tax=Burkholderia plantarii TaxID=41899 RepID=UPI0014961591|nr:hypothetical protein [Burkholderia plantarii]
MGGVKKMAADGANADESMTASYRAGRAEGKADGAARAARGPRCEPADAGSRAIRIRFS